MKKLPVILLFMLGIASVICAADTTTAENEDERTVAWINNLIKEQYPTFECDSFIFFYSGHRGINWAAISSGSTGYHLYSGNTHNFTIENDDPDYCMPDTLTLIKNNIKTITWAFETLPSAAEFIEPVKDSEYNPFVRYLYIINEGKITFDYIDIYEDYYGPKPKQFKKKLGDILYLMFWLSHEPSRGVMPTPHDSGAKY